MKKELRKLVGPNWRRECSCCGEVLKLEDVKIIEGSKSDDKFGIWINHTCGTTILIKWDQGKTEKGAA